MASKSCQEVVVACQGVVSRILDSAGGDAHAIAQLLAFIAEQGGEVDCAVRLSAALLWQHAHGQRQFKAFLKLPDRAGATIFGGDLHGCPYGAIHLLRCLPALRQKYQRARLALLGDYGDRGPKSLATVVLVLALRLALPNETFVAIQGNHDQYCQARELAAVAAAAAGQEDKPTGQTIYTEIVASLAAQQPPPATAASNLGSAAAAASSSDSNANTSSGAGAGAGGSSNGSSTSAGRDSSRASSSGGGGRHPLLPHPPSLAQLSGQAAPGMLPPTLGTLVSNILTAPPGNRHNTTVEVMQVVFSALAHLPSLAVLGHRVALVHGGMPPNEDTARNLRKHMEFVNDSIAQRPMVVWYPQSPQTPPTMLQQLVPCFEEGAVASYLHVACLKGAGLLTPGEWAAVASAEQRLKAAEQRRVRAQSEFDAFDPVEDAPEMGEVWEESLTKARAAVAAAAAEVSHLRERLRVPAGSLIRRCVSLLRLLHNLKWADPAWVVPNNMATGVAVGRPSVDWAAWTGGLQSLNVTACVKGHIFMDYSGYLKAGKGSPSTHIVHSAWWHAQQWGAGVGAGQMIVLKEHSWEGFVLGKYADGCLSFEAGLGIDAVIRVVEPLLAGRTVKAAVRDLTASGVAGCTDRLFKAMLPVLHSGRLLERGQDDLKQGKEAVAGLLEEAFKALAVLVGAVSGGSMPPFFEHLSKSELLPSVAVLGRTLFWERKRRRCRESQAVQAEELLPKRLAEDRKEGQDHQGQKQQQQCEAGPRQGAAVAAGDDPSEEWRSTQTPLRALGN